MHQLSFGRASLLVLIVLSVYFSGLGTARLWDRDEPRNSRASHEMLARGDWIVPTFNGELRDHKPILLYWGQMVSYALLGESEFTARLPSALCAMLSILTIAVLASRLSGKATGINRDGYWAAGALATCLFFVMAGRAATPDSCLIAFSTLGIAALVIGSLRPSPPYSSGSVGSTRWLYVLVGYTMLGLAVLAKGPVGVVLPLMVVHVWWLICDRWPTAGRSPKEVSRGNTLSQRGAQLLVNVWNTFNPWQCWRAVWALRVLPGILICLLAAAPWYIAVGIATDGAFLRGFFLEHNVGRAMDSMEGHGGSPFYYPFAFVLGTFPWSLWLIPIVLWCRRCSSENVVQRQMVVLAGAWIAVYVGAFSLASTKLPSYITPCYAGAALAIGGFWRQFESAWATPSWRWRQAAHGLTVAIGVLITTGIVVLSRREGMPQLATASAAGVIISLVGALGILMDRLQRTSWTPIGWLVGAAAFQITLFAGGASIVDSYRQDLATLTELDERYPTARWITVGGLEPSWVHYMDKQIEEVKTAANDEKTIAAVADFLRTYPDGKVLVAGEEAHAQFLNGWQERESSVARLSEITTAPRFLKTGTLRILGRSDDSRLAATVDAQHSRDTATEAAEHGNPIRRPLRSAAAGDAEPHNPLR